MKNLLKYGSIFLAVILGLMMVGCSPVISSEYTSEVNTFNQVALDTGVTLHYAERGNTEGEVIIFLPGYLDSWFSYSTVLDSLSLQYHAYAITQRGHGDSDKPEQYSMDLFAADINAFMEQEEIEKAVLVGHSMGTFIARQVALNHPAKVSHLVLIGAGVDSTTNELLLEFEDYLITVDEPLEREFVADFQNSAIFDSAPDGFMDGIIDESMKVPLHAWKGALAALNATNHTDQLSQITVPTLVLWGAEDTFFSRAEQDLMAAEMPNATLKVYPETVHGLQWEEPAEFVKDLEAFLK